MKLFVRAWAVVLVMLAVGRGAEPEVARFTERELAAVNAVGGVIEVRAQTVEIFYPKAERRELVLFYTKADFKEPIVEAYRMTRAEAPKWVEAVEKFLEVGFPMPAEGDAQTVAVRFDDSCALIKERSKMDAVKMLLGGRVYELTPSELAKIVGALK